MEKIFVQKESAMLWSKVLLRGGVTILRNELRRLDVQELLEKGLVKIAEFGSGFCLELVDPTLALTEPQAAVLQLLLTLQEPIWLDRLISAAITVGVLDPQPSIDRLIELSLAEIDRNHEEHIYPRFGLC